MWKSIMACAGVLALTGLALDLFAAIFIVPKGDVRVSILVWVALGSISLLLLVGFILMLYNRTRDVRLPH